MASTGSVSSTDGMGAGPSPMNSPSPSAVPPRFRRIRASSGQAKNDHVDLSTTVEEPTTNATAARLADVDMSAVEAVTTESSSRKRPTRNRDELGSRMNSRPFPKTVGNSAQTDARKLPCVSPLRRLTLLFALLAQYSSGSNSFSQ